MVLYFLFLITISAGAKCSLDCSGHGTCNNGICTCATGWTGPSCSKGMKSIVCYLYIYIPLLIFIVDQSQPISVQTNNTSPNVTITTPSTGDSASFIISISRLVEANSAYMPIRNISLENIRFQQTIVHDGSNTLYNYSTVLENGALINVLVYLFILLILLFFITF